MKRSTLNQREISELKKTLEYERDTFLQFAKSDIKAHAYGSVAENMSRARGLTIALERLEAQLNK